MWKLYCHKCGASLHKESHYCSNCGAKTEQQGEERTKASTLKRKSWVVPGATFIVAAVVLGCFFIYEVKANSAIEVMVKEAEEAALQGNLLTAKADFEQVLNKRPHHTTAAFNLEVIERGLHYENLLDEASNLAKNEQFDEGLRILEKLEQSLAKEVGPLFVQIKEKTRLKAASLTVDSVSETLSHEQMVEDLEDLLEKTVDFTSKEATKITELLKEKIVSAAINNGKKHLEKKQFTEAMLELDRGLTYDPTNEELLAFQETVKEKRFTFNQEEQDRLEKARAKAGEEEDLNWNDAVEKLKLDFYYNEDMLFVSGEVKNLATRPIAEVDAHFIIFDEDGNELEKSWTSVSPAVLLPNETGFFEVSLEISDEIGDVEVIDFYWTVK